jgi:hypothetical protein
MMAELVGIDRAIMELAQQCQALQRTVSVPSLGCCVGHEVPLSLKLWGADILVAPTAEFLRKNYAMELAY